MADNFDKLVKALVENNRSQEETTDAVDKLTKTMEDHFKFLKRQMKDQEEDRREAAKAKGEARAASPSTKSASRGLGLGSLGGIAGMLLPLTAGIAATASALSGLRGWELNAIKTINGMVKVPTTISNGMIRLRNATLGMFGLTAEGLLTRDAQGRFQRAAPITTQIGMRMNALRIRALNMFGIGADGKLLAVKGDDGLFKKNIIGRATFQVGRLLRPLVAVSEGVAKFATSKAGAFLKTLAQFGGKFGALFSKILWPVGFVISLFDGVKAYQESDADGYIAKLGDGVGGFLGSLIGAPFDLLKSGVRWIFNKLLGVPLDADGNATGEGWASWASNAMKEFSFEATISNIVSGLFGMVQGAVNWVALLFTDPTTALSKLWTGLLDTLGFAGKGLLDILWFPINTIVDWTAKKFGWRDEDAPKFNLRETITGWVTDFWNWLTGFLPNISEIASDLTTSITAMLPDWLKDSLGLGTDSTKEDAANLARQQGLIKEILKADINGDGILTKLEAEKFGGGSEAASLALASTINSLNTLRGGTLGSAAELAKNGQMVIINNVDASTNSGDTTAVSNSNAGAGSSALSAMDLMYFRREMKDNMLANPRR
jgi:uncharacterized membrane protein